MYIYIYTHKYIQIRVHMHLYMYIYTHMHVNIHTYKHVDNVVYYQIAFNLDIDRIHYCQSNLKIEICQAYTTLQKLPIIEI